ncbi:Zn-dependent hydrolase [Streptacidiphilus fuscans]|uniref:Zn-dependent hydrolase n=1 Tax=Streptacidiphilus fuscans TaxID=2789292 RepID=A0A931B4M4_9ACTN|nr:Zn-dependent hydrolase [Streptacidiphilus fuscans]MBF9070213.1 Zn-dependent hydrolase [Streptacidiphilus fuscans]
MNTPSINAQRLLTELTHLAQIGAGPDGAIHRVAGSRADLAARDWLSKTMQVAGLTGHRDEIGNVFGRVPGSTGPWVLLGSHADTVPAAGHLDGAYGVVAAIEVLRTLVETGHPAADHIEIVAFWDEEGVAPDSNGGLGGSTFLADSPHIDDIAAYLEVHVEQGPRMEAAGLDLAAVTGIVGVERYEIVMHGQENHGGASPFDMRADAGRAATRAAAALRPICQSIDPVGLIGNVGSCSFTPGAANVVPGEATLQIEIRGISEAVLDQTRTALREAYERIAEEENCTCTIRKASAKPVAEFNPEIVRMADEVCRASSDRTDRMASYAGHDASVMSTRVATGMIFVPSTSGISHNALEHTPDHQLVLGTQALLDTAVATAERLTTGQDSLSAAPPVLAAAA